MRAAEAAGADAEDMAATAVVEAADAAGMVAAAVVVVEDEGAAVVAADTGETVKVFTGIKQFSTGGARPLTPKGRAPQR